MNLDKLTDEVFVAIEPIVRLGDEGVEFVKRQARASARKRARICAHRTNDDRLHEMLIAIGADSYIRPHRHVGKSESFHIVDGIVDVVMLDETGAILDVIELGARGTGRDFYYRLDSSIFHTLLVRSDLLVVHEVTNGPFSRDATIEAGFAPPEHDLQAGREYMSALSKRAAEFSGEHAT